MEINSTFQSSILGIQRGISRIEKVSSDIAHNGSTDTLDPVTTTKSMVELNLQERNIQASAKIIKTANDMIDSILDIRV